MPRPQIPLPELPYELTDILKNRIVNRMIMTLCESIIYQIKDEDSEVYKICDDYIDSSDYKINDEERDAIIKTFQRSRAGLHTYVKYVIAENESKAMESKGRKRGPYKKNEV